MFPADLRPQIARASQLLAQARFAEAEREAQGALSVFGPNCGEALFLIGLARAGQNRPEDAVTLMAEAIAHLPPKAEAWYALGNQQMRLGRYADAEQSYARVLALAPGQAETCMALGFALLEQGRAAEAEAILNDGLRGKPHPMLAAGLVQNLVTGPH